MIALLKKISLLIANLTLKSCLKGLQRLVSWLVYKAPSFDYFKKLLQTHLFNKVFNMYQLFLELMYHVL